MLVFEIITFVLLLTVANIAVLAAGHLFGQQRMMNKMAVDAKRRERRQTNELRTLHNKFSEKAGFGSLYRRPAPQPQPSTTGRRITAPSQTISELKKEIGKVPKFKETVPPGIKEEFLNGAK